MLWCFYSRVQGCGGCGRCACDTLARVLRGLELAWRETLCFCSCDIGVEFLRQDSASSEGLICVLYILFILPRVFALKVAVRYEVLHIHPRCMHMWGIGLVFTSLSTPGVTFLFWMSCVMCWVYLSISSPEVFVSSCTVFIRFYARSHKQVPSITSEFLLDLSEYV